MSKHDIANSFENMHIDYFQVQLMFEILGVVVMVLIQALVGSV